MARFRLFGRTPERAPQAPLPGAPYGPPPGRAAAPPVGAGAPWPGGPATRSAQPVLPAPGHPGAVPPFRDDPPTDPHGFPPVRIPGAGPPAPVPRPPFRSEPPRTVVPVPDAAEAAALAGAFAVDYLSWDEDDPERRGRVLRDYLPVAGDDPAHLGWSGRGRQRAEFALTGRVRPDGEGRVLVDVRVRVTPYRPAGERAPAPEPDPEVAGVPAVAPAPTGRGWRSLASAWIRLSVPVVEEGGRLLVDAWEEALGEQAAPAPPAPPAVEDHALDEDDPLLEPRPGGAW